MWLLLEISSYFKQWKKWENRLKFEKVRGKSEIDSCLLDHPVNCSTVCMVAGESAADDEERRNSDEKPKVIVQVWYEQVERRWAAGDSGQGLVNDASAGISTDLIQASTSAAAFQNLLPIIRRSPPAVVV